jgi:hypothetical protein
VFAAVTVTAGLAGWLQLSPSGAGAPQILPLAPVHLRTAEALLDAQPSPGPAGGKRAAREIEAALAEEPGRAGAWLDLAAARRLEDGGYSPRVLQALRTSYSVGPLDPSVSYWRLRFAYGDWPDLPEELRTSVLRETDALWSTPDSREALKALPSAVDNPAGRAAAAAEVARVQLSEPPSL